MIENWSYNEHDSKAAADLASFIPERIFDVHAHLYRVADLHMEKPGLFTEGGAEISYNIWHQCQEKQLGKNRLTGGLFFPLPAEDSDIPKQNEYLSEQLDLAIGSKGLLLISPETQEDYILQALDDPRIVGLKPYHQYSTEKPTFESSIFGFMPEKQWALADQKQLIVTLHIVRAAALSDEGNLDTIRYVCEKYPGVKLILAHAARGFCSRNTVMSIHRLRGLDNIWFDSSGVCEVGALNAIINEFGSARLMWGSDLPLSEMRGKCVTIGDGFLWLNNTTIYMDSNAPTCKPILVGLESLRALREACESNDLASGDLQDIFHDNAMRLIGGTNFE